MHRRKSLLQRAALPAPNQEGKARTERRVWLEKKKEETGTKDKRQDTNIKRERERERIIIKKGRKEEGRIRTGRTKK